MKSRKKDLVYTHCGVGACADACGWACGDERRAGAEYCQRQLIYILRCTRIDRRLLGIAVTVRGLTTVKAMSGENAVTNPSNDVVVPGSAVLTGTGNEGFSGGAENCVFLKTTTTRM